MPRLDSVDPTVASGKTRELLEGVQSKLGMTPNLMRTMANSAAVLEGYLGLSGALANGHLSPELREQIALAVGEANGCDYCLAAHTAIAKSVGLSTDDILDSRRASPPDPHVAAALRFSRTLVDNRGRVEDADLNRLRAAGYGDGEIAEIVANVALNIFTNYFNHVAQTDIDFPRAEAIPQLSS